MPVRGTPFSWFTLLILAVIIRVPLPNMRSLAFLIPIGLASVVAALTYVLKDDYEAASFLNMFDFFTVSKNRPQNDSVI